MPAANVTALSKSRAIKVSLTAIGLNRVNGTSNNTDSRTTPTQGQIYPRSKMWKESS